MGERAVLQFLAKIKYLIYCLQGVIFCLQLPDSLVTRFCFQCKSVNLVMPHWDTKFALKRS